MVLEILSVVLEIYKCGQRGHFHMLPISQKAVSWAVDALCKFLEQCHMCLNLASNSSNEMLPA